MQRCSWAGGLEGGGHHRCLQGHVSASQEERAATKPGACPGRQHFGGFSVESTRGLVSSSAEVVSTRRMVGRSPREGTEESARPSNPGTLRSGFLNSACKDTEETRHGCSQPLMWRSVASKCFPPLPSPSEGQELRKAVLGWPWSPHPADTRCRNVVCSFKRRHLAGAMGAGAASPMCPRTSSSPSASHQERP